jgi:23S rRNA (uridine2552-2'-O)-methyltransferase
MRDRRTRHDGQWKRARKEGYAARSVYKLEELDQRFGLLRAGDRILDLGCAPGSWLKYAAQKAGPHGHAVGIDRLPLAQPIAGTRVLVGDIYETADGALLGELAAFDLVLSDMAPDTTGIRATDQARSAALVEEALGRAERMLAPGGAFVAKIFEGPDVEAIRRRMHQRFASVRTAKPEATRKISTEVYLVGKGFAPG